MTAFERFRVERRLRTLHSWLGALILPWIILAGLTGFYMNHRDAVLAVLPAGTVVDPVQFEQVPDVVAVADRAAAFAIARRYRPESAMVMDSDTRYRNRRVYTVDTGPDAVIVDRATGFAWHRQRYMITSYAPDGTHLGRELRWSRILSSLHQRGWVGTALGRWLADITAIALVVFGLSGLVLFLAPRQRRRKNRKAKKLASVRPSFPSSPSA